MNEILSHFSKLISFVIKFILFYLFILLVIKILYLIDDIFLIAETITDKIWNYVHSHVGYEYSFLGLILLVGLYLILPPHKVGIKNKLISLFEIITSVIKKVGKLLSWFYYLYDIEYLLEVIEGKSKEKLPEAIERLKNKSKNP